MLLDMGGNGSQGGLPEEGTFNFCVACFGGEEPQIWCGL